jgi:hypothetical protein
VRIETSAQFLTWLTDNDRTLADATQHHIDTWIDGGATTRRRVRDFLRWSHARGLSADLRVYWLAAKASRATCSVTTNAGHFCGGA